MVGHIQIALGSGAMGVRVTTMVKPWVVKAEKPTAPDLSLTPSLLRGGSSFSRRRDLVFVVNPKGLSL